MKFYLLVENIMSLPTQLSINAAPLGYCAQSIDTKIDADLVRFHLYRQRTTIERLILGAKYKQSARQFSLECLRQSFPELTPAAFAQKIAHAWLQAKCPVDYTPSHPMSWNQDPTAIAALLAQILNTANIPYYITGGVAAIAHGEPRATIDLDVVISIDLADLPTLAANFEAQGFYVAGLTDVLAGSLRCLNITHLETIENIDLMISGKEEYDLLKFDRKRLYTLPGSGEVAIASPEDVIISKLIWRRESQSDKQWRDILGVLKVQQEKLDFAYIQGWVERFGLKADWHRARLEAGIMI
jgi:hypothetical protein